MIGMPRPPRIFIPGVSVHITHRGNNRTTIFWRRQDYVRFLQNLRQATGECRVDVHGFALMTNHAHLVMTPERVDSIPRAMQKLGGRYVIYFNRTYGRTGTLWNGRYRPKLLDNERYCLTCLRYVDCNPVRAGMVATPDEYEWSGYRAHAYGAWPDWLKPHPVYLSLGRTAEIREAAYRALCASAINEAELAALRSRAPLPVAVPISQMTLDATL